GLEPILGVLQPMVGSRCQIGGFMPRLKFTPHVLEQIPKLVSDGKSASEIAGQIGCSVDSLRVRCSQLGVTLRGNGLTVRLSRTALDGLRQQAMAEDMSEAGLASALLEVIARDGLYKAVLALDCRVRINFRDVTGAKQPFFSSATDRPASARRSRRHG